MWSPANVIAVITGATGLVTAITVMIRQAGHSHLPARVAHPPAAPPAGPSPSSGPGSAPGGTTTP